MLIIENRTKASIIEYMILSNFKCIKYISTIIAFEVARRRAM
jgi:hypothetical protein